MIHTLIGMDKYVIHFASDYKKYVYVVHLTVSGNCYFLHSMFFKKNLYIYKYSNLMVREQISYDINILLLLLIIIIIIFI